MEKLKKSLKNKVEDIGDNSEIINSLLEHTDIVAADLARGLKEYIKSKELLELKDLYDEFAKIRDFDDVENFKSVVLKQVLYILKYGSSSERVRIIAELMKYLFPTKRDINLRHSGNIQIVMNPNIMGGDVSDVEVVGGGEESNEE